MGNLKKVKIILDLHWFLVVYSVMMRKLIKEVREIKRKLALPIKRTGSRGMLVSIGFTEREKSLLIEMLTRRSKRDTKSDKSGHIFPTKIKGTRANSTQQRAMELIRKGEWVI